MSKTESKKAEALEKKQSAELARPAFLQGEGVDGTEHITRDDIKMPRLAIAQKMSPELEEGHTKFIEGLVEGDLFNNLTGEILGKGPLTFMIIRADPPRWIEFFPREQGGGIKDPNVPAGDPRTFFTMKDGKSEPPAATKFYDYIIALLPFGPNPMDSLIALSMKSTQLKVARELNGLIKLRKAPIFAGKYTVETKTEKNAKGSYKQFVVKNAGWVTEEEFKIGRELFEALKDREITIERDDAPDPDHPNAEVSPEDGDTTFDTSAM